jgi:hypothetical protein
MNQGSSKIEVTFDKNTFEPREHAHATVYLDNKACNVALQHITMAVEQEIEINTGPHRYHDTYTLLNK